MLKVEPQIHRASIFSGKTPIQDLLPTLIDYQKYILFYAIILTPESQSKNKAEAGRTFSFSHFLFWAELFYRFRYHTAFNNTWMKPRDSTLI